MQKLQVLIEENAFGSVRSLEVAATAPVSALIPTLVTELKLPQTDLFGKQLVYVLCEAGGGRILPEHSTLLTAGVKPGTRLALDSYVIDGSVAAVMGNAQVWGTQGSERGQVQRAGGQGIGQPQEVGMVEVQTYGGGQGTGRTPESPPRYMEAGTSLYREGDRSSRLEDEELDPTFHAATTLVDYSSMPESDARNTSVPLRAVRKRSWSRRAFLSLGSAALVAGGAGLGYAAYHTWMNGGLKVPRVAKTASPPSVQKVPAKPVLPTMAKPLFTFTLHQQIVRAISWSPDGTMLTSGADDAQVFIWSMNGTVRQHIQHPAAVRAAVWSPDGQQLVTGAGNQVTFFHPLTGAILARSTNQHVGTVTSLAWTAHNQMQVVSGATDMRAVVWSSSNHQPGITFLRHTTPIDAVTWAADGQTVASSSQGGVVRIWNAENGQELHPLYLDAQIPMRAIAFAPAGAQLAVGGDDGMVRLWHGLTCQQPVMGNPIDHCADVPMRLPASKQAIRAVAWSPDARLLAIGGNDGMFSIWYPAQSQKPLLTVQQNAAIHSITWMPNGTHIATAEGNTVTIWGLM